MPVTSDVDAAAAHVAAAELARATRDHGEGWERARDALALGAEAGDDRIVATAGAHGATRGRGSDRRTSRSRSVLAPARWDGRTQSIG
jgi:hypothetical protein